VPHGAYVNGPAAFIAFVDLSLARHYLHPASNPGGKRVPVKNSDQPGRHSE
jgi:hypothetical protein